MATGLAPNGLHAGAHRDLSAPQGGEATRDNCLSHPLRERFAKITPLEVSNVGTGDLVVWGVRMNMEDSRLIAQFQRLTTELLIEKRLGRRRPELTDELYRTWLEVDQRDLKETPEYRNVMKRADRHALWLAGLVMLSNSDAAAPLSSKEIEPIVTDEAA
jgi:hypothetical protein